MSSVYLVSLGGQMSIYTVITSIYFSIQKPFDIALFETSKKKKCKNKIVSGPQ